MMIKANSPPKKKIYYNIRDESLLLLDGMDVSLFAVAYIMVTDFV